MRATRTTIAEAAEETNEAAQAAYARSVLMDHWRREGDDDDDEDKDEDVDKDDKDEESLALTTAAVRLPEVRRYLRSGTDPYRRPRTDVPPPTTTATPSSSRPPPLSPGSRLRRVRETCRRALGRRGGAPVLRRTSRAVRRYDDDCHHFDDSCGRDGGHARGVRSRVCRRDVTRRRGGGGGGRHRRRRRCESLS
jgi:hypothetical protein